LKLILNLLDICIGFWSKSKPYFTSCACLHRYCLLDFMCSRVLFMSYTVMAVRVDKIGFYLANCLREIRRFTKADRVIFVTSRRNQGSHFQYIPSTRWSLTHSWNPFLACGSCGSVNSSPPEFPTRVIELRDCTGREMIIEIDIASVNESVDKKKDHL